MNTLAWIALAHDHFLNATTYFWCLEANIKPFSDIFKSKTIQIKSVEAFLEGLFLERQHSSKAPHSTLCQLLALIEEKVKVATNIETTKENAAREYVTLKALIQFFLPMYLDGYFMDTNIIPDPEEASPYVRVFDEFIAPILLKRKFAGGVAFFL